MRTQNVQDAWARWMIGLLRAKISAFQSYVPERIPFSYAGALAVSTSPPWAPVHVSTLTGCRALLGTAGTSSTVVTVYVNGVSKGTVTLTSGQTNVGASLTSTALAADTDLVTVGVTTVGTGAADLTVLVRVA